MVLKLEHKDSLPTGFFDLFSLDDQQIIKFILARDFELILVGGASRDYLLYNKLTTDLDFELRHKTSFSGAEWELKIKSMGDSIQNELSFAVTFLPFSILRVQTKKSVLEFASPRIESYPQNKRSVGHSEFSVDIKSQIDFKRALERRDFTFNAIGFHVNDLPLEFVVNDPLNGINDLQKKVLRPCGDNFYKDPVRLLRLVRFQTDLEGTISSDLKKNIGKFNLMFLTPYYFFSEVLKAKNTCLMIKCFFKTIDEKGIDIPEELRKIKFLEKLGEFHNLKIEKIEELLFLAIFHLNDIEETKIFFLADYAKLKKVRVKSIFMMKKSLEEIRNVSLQSLQQSFKDDTIIDFLQKPEVLSIKRFHQYWIEGENIFVPLLKSFPSLFNIYGQMKSVLPNEFSIADREKFLSKYVEIPDDLRSLLPLYAYLQSLWRGYKTD